MSGQLTALKTVEERIRSTVVANNLVRGVTHAVSPNIGRCELTFMEREQIDYELAVQQHEEYCRMLARRGVAVTTLYDNLPHADCCFVEDTAIVVDELAIIASMGAVSRRSETAAVASELAKYRELVCVSYPSMIEGGDVLQAGKNIFVGLSTRTNHRGIEEVIRILKTLDYRIVPVPVRGSLHLTTACSFIDDETVLINPRWADADSFRNFRILHTPEDEPWSANTFRIGETVCLEASFPKTIELVHEVHDDLEVVNISEFRKAEGGLSCLSLLFRSSI
jgi:dimethylargininase